MALKLKAGVDLRGVRPETAIAMQVVDGACSDHGAHETVITSVKDSKHMATSLHYQGLAFDVRLPSRCGAKHPDIAVAGAIRTRLGEQFDVVLEHDHIHVEFDPD